MSPISVEQNASTQERLTAASSCYEVHKPGKTQSAAVLLSGRERFSPYYGGALARWTYEVYSRLPQNFKTTVFGFSTADEDRYPLSHQTSRFSRICDFVSKVPRLRRYEDYVWLRALFSQLRDHNFVHIHNRPQWVPILRDFGYKGKLVLHLQNDHLGHWTAPMLHELAPQVDAIVTCSEYLRGTFASKSRALAAKTHVMFNGVNTALFYPREEVREPQTIFFVGRFHPEKGILQLVQAYGRVLRSHPHAMLVIGGTTGFGTHSPDPYVREVEALAASLVKSRSARIQFTGYLHHDRDLPGRFQRAAIFASPSIFQEPFGLVNAEAMACAAPVVGANRGGISEVLGDTGLLINPEDIEAFADALSRLLGDKAYRMKLGHAAYERCRGRFDWEVIARQWSSFLSELAESG